MEPYDWTPKWGSLLPLVKWHPPEDVDQPPEPTGLLLNHRHVVPRTTGLKAGDEVTCTLCQQQVELRALKKFMATKTSFGKQRGLDMIYMKKNLVDQLSAYLKNIKVVQRRTISNR